MKSDVRSSQCKKEGRTLRGGSHITFFLAMACYDGVQRYFFNSGHSIKIRIKVKIFCLIRAQNFCSMTDRSIICSVPCVTESHEIIVIGSCTYMKAFSPLHLSWFLPIRTTHECDAIMNSRFNLVRLWICNSVSLTFSSVPIKVESIQSNNNKRDNEPKRKERV